MRTQWNTGRKYTAYGQRIVAEWKDGTVKFVDHDRMIWGTFKMDGEPLTEAHLRDAVSVAYDRNDYAIAHIARGELRWTDAT